MKVVEHEECELPELKRHLEFHGNFEKVDNDGKTSTCPTGEPYVTLCSGGIKPEGASVPAYYASVYDAVKAFETQFNNMNTSVKHQMTVGNRPSLYWRWTPRLSTYYDRYTVIARLAISARQAPQKVSTDGC